MTFAFLLLGGIALVSLIVVVLDGIGLRQQRRKAGKS